MTRRIPAKYRYVSESERRRSIDPRWREFLRALRNLIRGLKRVINRYQ